MERVKVSLLRPTASIIKGDSGRLSRPNWLIYKKNHFQKRVAVHLQHEIKSKTRPHAKNSHWMVN